MDCKDKVIKFYHFKRKVREVQKQNFASSRQATQQKERKTKIVQKIVDIVENYTEKCSVSSIRIEEGSKKLIIESRDSPQAVPNNRTPEKIVPTRRNIPSTSSSLLTPSSEMLHKVIKQEPCDPSESLWPTFPAEVAVVPSLDESLDEIVVKEEPKEQPVIFDDIFAPLFQPSLSQQRRFSRKSTTDDEASARVSKAAMKMRAYRARLRRPENRNRYLKHKEQQREWNRRHYLKKQFTTGTRRQHFELDDMIYNVDKYSIS